jgi:hypothetical protein
VVEHHLKRKPGKLPKQILDNIYVDNIHVGFENPKEVQHLFSSLKSLFADAAMNVREFVHTGPKISAIPKEDTLPSSKGNDMIRLALPTFDKAKRFTKRTALSYVASPFDPTGMISPVILPARNFLHSIWDQALGWDDPLPPDKEQE